MLSLHLLGRFHLIEGDVEINIDHTRMQELLAYLAIHRQQAVMRRHLAFLL
jgi:DNA-binding SARP family transcriptional activator